MSLSLEALLDNLIRATAYSEPPSDHHHNIIEKVWSEVVKPALPTDQALDILDIGAGDGFFMQIAEANGHDVVGLNYTDVDAQACIDKGLRCQLGDMHYLPAVWKDFYDLVWARHVFEHSPFPMRALSEAHAVLTPGGLLYMEVPSGDTACMHEFNANHYSIFSQRAWSALIQKSGFEILQESELTFRVIAGEDKYFLWLCRKPVLTSAK